MQPDNREWTDFSEYRACVASQIDTSVISIEEEGRAYYFWIKCSVGSGGIDGTIAGSEPQQRIGNMW